ncbi:protein phosphatase 2C domain-containing protein [Patescibacteria group bacterium]|nr:protein phosphatase 2C domain-containing protein [Patescibacteria group bacterium]
MPNPEKQFRPQDMAPKPAPEAEEELGAEDIEVLEGREELSWKDVEALETPTTEDIAKTKRVEEQEIEKIKKDIDIAEADLEKGSTGQGFGVSLKKEGRDKNQDAFAIGENYLVAADGVGGEAGGAEASRVIIEAVQRGFREKSEVIQNILNRGSQEEIEVLLAQFTVEAQNAVATTGVERSGTDKLGSTFTMALRWQTPEKKKFWGLTKEGGDEKISFAQIGDSRLYRLRDKKLERVSRDQSITNFLIDLGVFPDDQSSDIKYTLPEIEQKVLEAAEANARNMAKRDGLDPDEHVEQILALAKDQLGKMQKKLLSKTAKLINQPGHYRVARGKKQALFSVYDVGAVIGAGLTAEKETARGGAVQTVDAQKDDIFIGTSDGIHDNLFDSEIEAIANNWNHDQEKMNQMLVIASKIRMGEKKLEDYPELKNIVRMDEAALERAKADDALSVSFAI